MHTFTHSIEITHLLRYLFSNLICRIFNCFNYFQFLITSVLYSSVSVLLYLLFSILISSTKRRSKIVLLMSCFVCSLNVINIIRMWQDCYSSVDTVCSLLMIAAVNGLTQCSIYRWCIVCTYVVCI